MQKTQGEQVMKAIKNLFKKNHRQEQEEKNK